MTHLCSHLSTDHCPVSCSRWRFNFMPNLKGDQLAPSLTAYDATNSLFFCTLSGGLMEDKVLDRSFRLTFDL